MINAAIAVGTTLSAFGLKELVDVTKYNAKVRNILKED